MKKVLVVGGAGYIGSHVNLQLYQAGYDTVVLDNLSRGHRDAVVQGTFIEGDIANAALLESLFTKHSFDAVMHFAAFTDVGESVLHPFKYFQNNVTNTLNLLNCMVKHQISVFIFSSSAAIFGLPKTKKISETHPCDPINPYGHSKLFIEKILHHFDQAYGLKYCALRYFNAAGGDPSKKIKYFPRKESNLIPLVLKAAKENKPITIFGNDYPTIDGTCIRDYIHILDLGDAHIAALERLLKGGSSDCYNLGNGNGFSVREVIQTAQHVVGRPIRILEGQRRPGDPPALVADASKAIKELQWKPKYSQLVDMIKHSWELIN